MKRETVQIQSAEVDTPALGEEREAIASQEETVQFVEQSLAPEVGRPTVFEPTYGEHNDEIASLGKFLERPVLIDQFTWNESDTFSLSPRSIDPWFLYFNNTYIKSKLANFSRLHCSLHLTFRFNASPFYYGALRACYDPLKSGKFDPLSTKDICPLSQTHGVMLEPQVASSAELVLPFLWPHSWLNTAVASQFHQMGKILFQVFAQLQSANGVTGSGITVSTYARAENIQIAGPTTQAILQSGIVSGPAAAIAGFARNFATSNAIGPYARAVDIGASAVSRIAKIFGFSNAPMTVNVNPVQNKVFHAFANTETRVPLDKLAIDPANEVTIDNRVAGDVGEDPLIIQKIVTKPSCIGSVTWSSGTAASTILTHCPVSPAIVLSGSGTGQTLWYYTPSGLVADMFRFWRGGMRYTFRVVRSPYHKGRLMVSWDPNCDNNAMGVETAVFSKIFDLSSPDQEFSIDIPYKANPPWLGTYRTWGLNAGAYTPPDYSNWNGYWNLGVLNALTSPVASTSITILVYASAMDDMEFAAPTTLPTTVTTATVQSGITDGSATVAANESGVVDGSDVKYSERIPDITVGERVGSLRTLLHRATRCLTQHIGLNGASGGSYSNGTYHTVTCLDRLPPTYGFQPSDSYNWATSIIATGTKPCNYAVTHPLNWVLSAFVGYRGSIVVHANVSGIAASNMWNMSLTRIDHNYCDISTSSCSRNNTWQKVDITGSPATIVTNVLGTSSGANSIPYWPTGTGGTTVTNGATQMSMSAVIPQYARTRFMPAAFTQRNNDFIDDVFDGCRLDCDFTIADGVTAAKSWPHVDVYWAAGVDFNPVFWTGVPRMYNYNSTPTLVTTPT